jgi:hypothetical protein
MRTKPILWKRIVKEIKEGSKGGKPGIWSARKAQLAVHKYKSLGGDYTGTKKNNSLVLWTKQNWGYIDNKKGNRYLPKQIRNSLTQQEKIEENKRKRVATKLGKTRASYSISVLKKMQKYLN